MSSSVAARPAATNCGKPPAGSTEEKTEPTAISVVELAPIQARVPASCDVSNIPIVAAIVLVAVTQQTAALPGICDGEQK